MGDNRMHEFFAFLVFTMVSFQSSNGCNLGIIVDNSFVLYIDGVQVPEGSGSDYSQLYSFDVSTSSGVIGIKATNDQGYSGILVTSDAGFYSTGSSSTGFDWRCIQTTELGTSDTTNNAWATSGYDASNWPRAVSIGSLSNTLPWSNSESSYRSQGTIDDRAQWIWNENYGTQSQDGDREVYCRALLSGTCNTQSTTTSTQAATTTRAGTTAATTTTSGQTVDPNDCTANGGSRVGSFCLKLISGGFTYEQAAADAASRGGELVSITSPELQNGVRNEMASDNVDKVWTGGKQINVPPNLAWGWIESCCKTVSGSLDLAAQGCFADSTEDGRDLPDSPDPLISAGQMTIQGCIAGCSGYSYAGLQDGDYCYCGNTYGSYGQTVGCDSVCTGNSTTYCGGTNKNFVYQINGKAGEWYGGPGNQPNNYDGVQFCGAVRGNTAQLEDEGCKAAFRYLCEVPAESNGCPSRTGYTTYTYLSRCFLLSTTSLSWFNARQTCRNMNGDLASLTEQEVYDSILRNFPSSLGTAKVWLGLQKKIWKWPSGEDFTYSNFVSSEPQLPNDWMCVYIDNDEVDSYQWRTGPCDAISHQYSYILKTVIVETTTTTTTSTTTTPTTTTTTTATTTTPSTTTTTPTTTTTKTTEAAATLAPPQSGAAAASSDDGGIATWVIILIVVIILLILILIIIIICLCCCKGGKSERHTQVAPVEKKGIVDVRGFAPLPYYNNLGESDSGQFSENGSQTDLVH